MKPELAQICEEATKAISLSVKEKHPISMLEQLGVSQRLINLLHANGIDNMHDLMHKSKDDLLGLQNFGVRQLQILFEAISKYHLIEE
jgi:DNA-directed RNA polymerase alpha subunit